MEAHARTEAKSSVEPADPFTESRDKFDSLVTRLERTETLKATHSKVEEDLNVEGRELLRQLFQDHLRLRAREEERRRGVVGSEGVERHEVIKSERPLKVIFGEVEAVRLAYRAPRKEAGNLMPLDAELNLPQEVFSFGLQKRAAFELAKCSFEETKEALENQTGMRISKHALEQLAPRLAADFEAFYGQRSEGARAFWDAVLHPSGIQSPVLLDRSKLLVLTTDGKGVWVIEEDLRPATRKKAAKRKAERERTDPFEPGPKPYKRRMAQVCAVYTIAPFPREPEDLLRELRHLQPVEGQQAKQRPKPEHKRVWASVVREPEEVIEGAFLEAMRRDPKREMRWVIVVDGSDEQLRIIRRLERKYGVQATLVLDYIHLSQYLWKAAYVFHERGSDAARRWVDERLLAVLQGKASSVVAGMRRSATRLGIPKKRRKAVDKCARYILKRTDMLRYDRYLAEGLPIGSGVIEGACRHLMKDRMDLSGATWTIERAEAILRLRALRSSGDFTEYWAFHEEQELSRNHLSRFDQGAIPPPPSSQPSRSHPRHLQVVK
jgi:hypothetical protein